MPDRLCARRVLADACRSRPTSIIAAGRAAAPSRTAATISASSCRSGRELGGPLFFAHYSFLGLDPRGLTDRYADYWAQNVAHTLHQPGALHRQSRPLQGLRPDCWGLTASDTFDGYTAHSPTQRPRRHLADRRALLLALFAGGKPRGAPPFPRRRSAAGFCGEYGFQRRLQPERDWFAESYLAIDQGPIVVMIENFRSGLLWRLFMSCPEVAGRPRQARLRTPAARRLNASR